MHSIITLFRYFIGWTSIIGTVVPVIGAILARRNGVKLSFEMRLFEFYCYVAAIGQFIAVIMAFTIGNHQFIFRLITLVEIIVFMYLLLKWMNFDRYYFKSLLFIFPILLIGDYLFESRYPDFMLWFEISIYAILSVVLSYIIDRDQINFPKEYTYIQLGIYLSSVITVIGFTPSGTELRQFGHLVHVTANITAFYYYYRSFRCLYP